MFFFFSSFSSAEPVCFVTLPVGVQVVGRLSFEAAWVCTNCSGCKCKSVHWTWWLCCVIFLQLLLAGTACLLRPLDNNIPRVKTSADTNDDYHNYYDYASNDGHSQHFSLHGIRGTLQLIYTD